MRKLWICTFYGVYLDVHGVGKHLHVLYHCLPLLPTYRYTMCVMMMCVPLTLKLFMVYVINLISEHPPSLPYATGGCLGTKLPLWTAFYITLSVMFQRNWWKEVWSRHSLVWCLMWMLQYSWMLSGDSWRIESGWWYFFDSLPQRSSVCVSLLVAACSVVNHLADSSVQDTLSDDCSEVHTWIL